MIGNPGVAHRSSLALKASGRLRAALILFYHIDNKLFSRNRGAHFTNYCVNLLHNEWLKKEMHLIRDRLLRGTHYESVV
jgi:hypothetical protein